MSKDKVIYVTMIGSQSVGKSSVMAAMVDNLEAMKAASGARFVPDAATAALMQSRRTALSRVFDEPLATEEFSLQEDASAEKDRLRTYRFAYRAGITDKSRFSLEFTDVPTERMTENSPEIIQQVRRSAVVIIAIDSIALMEKNEEGSSWHELVNMPQAIHGMMMDASLTMENPTPQLVLFVPLKCEKYYHQLGGMEALEQAVRKAYAPTLAFLDQTAFTVGITPILTLGDVMFSRFAPGSAGYAPLYVFRRQEQNGAEHRPLYSPRFGEQPLCWMAAYLLQLERFQKEQKKQRQNKLFRMAKVILLMYSFGLMGLAARQLTAFLKDSNVRRMMNALRSQLKLQGNGYALIQDHLCLSEPNTSIKAIAAELQ